MEPNYSSPSKSKSNQGGSTSPSSANAKSYINELFGPKPSSSQPPSGVNSSILNSVFGPPSTGGRSGQAGNAKHGAPGNGSKGENNRNAYFQQQEPVDQSACYFSNSIYYGGQEAYSPTTLSKDSLNFKKDQQDDDPDSASRGNWWQGSLYY